MNCFNCDKEVKENYFCSQIRTVAKVTNYYEYEKVDNNQILNFVLCRECYDILNKRNIKNYVTRRTEKRFYVGDKVLLESYGKTRIARIIIVKETRDGFRYFTIFNNTAYKYDDLKLHIKRREQATTIK